jgi:hypothetical protein
MLFDKAVYAAILQLYRMGQPNTTGYTKVSDCPNTIALISKVDDKYIERL